MQQQHVNVVFSVRLDARTPHDESECQDLQPGAESPEQSASPTRTAEMNHKNQAKTQCELTWDRHDIHKPKKHLGRTTFDPRSLIALQHEGGLCPSVFDTGHWLQGAQFDKPPL